VTGTWHAIAQRSSPRRNNPGSNRNDRDRPAGTIITAPDRPSLNDAAVHHASVTTRHDRAAER